MFFWPIADLPVEINLTGVLLQVLAPMSPGQESDEWMGADANPHSTLSNRKLKTAPNVDKDVALRSGKDIVRIQKGPAVHRR